MEGCTSVPLVEFFNNKTILLTGVTGFVGKSILEKLMRSCPGFRKIYVLIRSRRNQSPAERLAAILQTELFKKVKLGSNTADNVASRVVAINGDITQAGLGISSEDEALLISTVTIVFHVAGCVKFNAGLETLLKVNVNGTKNMIEWSKRLSCLKAFVYVSTVFSNSTRTDIGEEVYPIGINPHVAIKLHSGLPTHVMNSMEKKLVDKNKTLYTFSKHLAEVLVHESRLELPICIVRPAVVGPAHREPFPGWVDNFNGMCGFIAGMSVGVIRAMYTNQHGTVDVVPVDHVANLTIAAVARLGSSSECELKVYNCSNNDHPFICKELQASLMEAFEQTPFDEIFWYPSTVWLRSRIGYEILNFWLHFIPALMADGVCILVRSKPKMLERYRKARELIELCRELQRANYCVQMENTKALYQSLGPIDQETFNFNIRDVDVHEYFQVSFYGIKYFAAKQEYRNLPRAKRNFRRAYMIYVVSCSMMVILGGGFLLLLFVLILK